MARESLEVLAEAYYSFKELADEAGFQMPANRRVGFADEHHLLRFLDCAVIKHLHAAAEDAKMVQGPCLIGRT
ncbi:hypothetical protein H4P12_16995 [Paracoccus sp. 11-3]|uniref:Uncharacterized protein n=1 Tax=Paracoccus amoyensis TaxID=2760093 RepID=A0A926JCN5_9RHOB|nr:hypothetical protein [Paracoccus amoyensis]MBC9248366.1 hypothetical protein [Paracoccus amoyensis]